MRGSLSGSRASTWRAPPRLTGYTILRVAENISPGKALVKKSLFREYALFAPEHVRGSVTEDTGLVPVALLLATLASSLANGVLARQRRS
jgi:hypothetical protein